MYKQQQKKTFICTTWLNKDNRSLFYAVVLQNVRPRVNGGLIFVVYYRSHEFVCSDGVAKKSQFFDLSIMLTIC